MLLEEVFEHILGEQTLKETAVLKELVDLVDRKKSSTFFCEKVDVEAIELMVRGIADTLLYQTDFLSGFYAVMRIQATEHLAKHGDLSHFRIFGLDVTE